MTQPKRSSFRAGKLSYAEVGASQLPDLLQFPPNQATVFSLGAKLGSGQARFAAASAQLLSGAALQECGFTLLEHGELPLHAQQQEAFYSADGTAYLTLGQQVRAPQQDAARLFTVVRIALASQQVGLVLGTADDGAYTGEVSCTVELREHDEVWAFARGFWHDHTKRFLGLGESGPQQAKRLVAALLLRLAPTAQLLPESDAGTGAFN